MCDCFGQGLNRRTFIASVACLSVGVAAFEAKSQVSFKNQLAGACNFFPGDPVPAFVQSFGSSDEAKNVVAKIMSATGLKPNFEIISYGVPNAAAIIQNGVRYILYNPAFIAQISNQAGSQWASWTIMAHEVGHHLNGHTLIPGGSKPPSELEADEFAGFAVRRIGGTLEQALSPYMTMNAEGSSTHPPRIERIAAVTKGWNAAAGTGGDIKVPKQENVPAAVVSTRDMLTAIVSNLQNGVTPPFPMSPDLKKAYDMQAPAVGMQLRSLGSLIGLDELRPPIVTPNSTFYEYRSRFSAGKADWKIEVAPSGLINSLWVQ